LKDAVLDERIRLKWIWKNWVGKTWSALEYGQVARCCQHGYETAWISWLAEELLTSEEEAYSEVSWIVTNKFNHNELRSYRGNIITGLPLQEWLTRPYDILEHHQPHHIPDLQDSPLHTLEYSSKFIPLHTTLPPNVLLLDNWHARCCNTQIQKINITTYFFTKTRPNPCLIATNFRTLYTCITFQSCPTAHYRLNVDYTAC
jgi:hypothetical protein